MIQNRTASDGSRLSKKIINQIRIKINPKRLLEMWMVPLLA